MKLYFQEFPVRESRVCLFSHGGHMLVAAVKDVIHVYNTISFKLVHLLKVVLQLNCWLHELSVCPGSPGRGDIPLLVSG